MEDGPGVRLGRNCIFGLSFWVAECFEIGGDGCITLNILKTPLNCIHFKRGNFTLRELQLATVVI